MEDFAAYLREQGIIAYDSSTKKLYSDALSIAPTDANVLIVGASGTGKDCLAKFIHRHSVRSSAPFVHVNCSAIPGELFESEFFGYESGAFTGGSFGGHRGLVAEAAGGTLFLDEIGELDLTLQTKLLQVVQEHSMRRIGSTQNTAANIRIIAATNRQLPMMIKDGAFRLDLYYSLNVVTFEILPLHRRKQDIKGLIEYLSAQYEQLYGCKKIFTTEAMALLMDQEWLGNIREIQNFLEKLYVLEEDQMITDSILRDNYRFSHSVASSTRKMEFKPLKQAVAEFERNYITEVLRYTQDMDKAAEILEVGRSVLDHIVKRPQ